MKRTPLPVLMESRMRGNSQVRFGGRRRGDRRLRSRHRRLAADPARRWCRSRRSRSMGMQQSAWLTAAASRTVPTPAKAAVRRGRDRIAAPLTRSRTVARGACSSSNLGGLGRRRQGGCFASRKRLRRGRDYHEARSGERCSRRVTHGRLCDGVLRPSAACCARVRLGSFRSGRSRVSRVSGATRLRGRDTR